uniref:HEAT repeat-containing protein 1 n=1 Tax=Lygus hesperus TaxID=30085 RepID=A0A146LEH2_LYGHE
MHLLVSAMEMFAYYTELNVQTPNHVTHASLHNNNSNNSSSGSSNVRVEQEVVSYSEDKAYTMLLELLSGNTLACVLASINEPTFVQCERRLLSDTRMSLKQKGIEVLLDRLHHSLPTTEATLSAEEVEARRRALRDPKVKLTLMDLVKMKARPLTTKRSFLLFDQLVHLVQSSFLSVTQTIQGLAQRQRRGEQQ